MTNNPEKNKEIISIFNECIPILSVLADAKRQEIILILAECPEGITVNSITEKINLSRPAVSHHLKVLKQAGIIDVINKGVENYYYLTPKETIENLKRLITIIEENCML